MAAVLLLVGAGGAVAAGSAGAATLPLPSSALANPLDGSVLGGALTQTQEGVQGTVTGLLASSSPTPTPSGDAGSGASTPAPRTAPATTTTPGTTGPSRTTATTRTSSAQQSPAASSSPGDVRAATPVASVCLIPTGSASPAFEVGLDVLGQDLSSPLVKQFPQAFAACPAGAVRADADMVAAVDATVNGLLGACVRVTRQVAPLRTTLVVLDHDLIRELTAAGVPLDQLVAPCPTAAAAAPDEGSSATPGASGPSAASSGAGAASALPARLAFTGTEPGPVLFAAVTLLCAGALLLRKARLLGAAARG
jgi:hypothetical protein